MSGKKKTYHKGPRARPLFWAKTDPDLKEIVARFPDLNALERRAIAAANTPGIQRNQEDEKLYLEILNTKRASVLAYQGAWLKRSNRVENDPVRLILTQSLWPVTSDGRRVDVGRKKELSFHLNGSLVNGVSVTQQPRLLIQSNKKLPKDDYFTGGLNVWGKPMGPSENDEIWKRGDYVWIQTSDLLDSQVLWLVECKFPDKIPTQTALTRRRQWLRSWWTTEQSSNT